MKTLAEEAESVFDAAAPVREPPPKLANLQRIKNAVMQYNTVHALVGAFQDS